jgi:hypothetical protein
MLDVAVVNISGAYSPQEEKIHASTHLYRRKLGRIVPKDLVNIWQSQQSTDPKSCPPKEMGLQIPTQAQVLSQRQSFNI